jgi:hypothetical protein
MKFGPVLCQACYETLRIRPVAADEIRQPADLLRTESAIDKFLDPSDRFWYIRRIVPVAVFQSRRFNQTLQLIINWLRVSIRLGAARLAERLGWEEMAAAKRAMR